MEHTHLCRLSATSADSRTTRLGWLRVGRLFTLRVVRPIRGMALVVDSVHAFIESAKNHFTGRGL
jgi:hypothetical protein